MLLLLLLLLQRWRLLMAAADARGSCGSSHSSRGSSRRCRS
jgi:hypothetical protein